MKLKATQKKKAGLLAKGLFLAGALRRGVGPAKATQVFDALLNVVDSDNQNPKGEDLKAAILEQLGGNSLTPKAAGDWLAIIEKLLPLILQILPIIFGLFA